MIMNKNFHIRKIKALFLQGFLSLICFLSFNLIYAQDNSIRFNNITINEGLSQSTINSIIQDKEGFIWLGTQEGLNKYDGYNFNIYKPNHNNPYSISNPFIRDVYQDSEGLIWVATSNGLNKLDKTTNEITHYNYSKTDVNSISEIITTSIVQDNQGVIWVGTESKGICKIDKSSGKITRVNSTNSSLPNNQILKLYKDKDGFIWIGTHNGLVKANSETNEFTIFKNDIKNINSIGNNVVWSIKQDSLGLIWLGTSKGLYKFNNNTNAPIFTEIKLSEKSSIINAILIDRNQTVWVGTNGDGLYKVYQETGRYKLFHFDHNDGDSKSILNNLIYDLFEDNAGNIWVGTKNGASKFDPLKQGFVHIKQDNSKENKLADNNVWCTYAENNNILWIGTRKGVSRYDRTTQVYTNYSRETHNPNRPNDMSVFYIHKDKDGLFWLGMADGVFTMHINADSSATFEKIIYKDENPSENNPVSYHILEGKNGHFWLSSKEGLAKYNKETKAYQFFPNFNNNPRYKNNKVVRQTYQDKDGIIWAATFGEGLIKVTDGEEISFKKYNKQNTGFATDEILCIWEEGDVLWLGTYGQGLHKFNKKTGKTEKYTEEDGLSNNAVYGILGDENGNLWMSTNRGVSKFNIKTEAFINYSQKDGLQNEEFNTGAFEKTNDGYLIFGGINGLNIFKPEDIKINNTAPKVALTGFIYDNKPYKLGGNSPFTKTIGYTNEIELPYYKSEFAIEFAALHFTSSQGNEYKYIMEGMDEEFKMAEKSRSVIYPKLPPGEYVFKVYAANSDGVWSDIPASLKIIIHPPYWKTLWFQSLMVLAVLGLVYGIYRYRVSAIRESKLKLEKIVERRTKEVTEQKEKIEKQKGLLQAEKEKAEKLLLNILPEETVEELKSKGKASARNYRRVSVMFTDFKGFTTIAEKLRPAKLVEKLDTYFVEFDKIVAKHNLEKIKTIGDSYMAAGGVPVRNKENPIHSVLAALELQRYMQYVKENTDDPEDAWQIRIGINTGETIAGVIGIKRFAYDIWGNTVNVAARMEEACEPGMINVSGKTFDHIEPYFECTYRGKIPAKNKGHIAMYYVHRIKPELSIDGKGIEPNKQFWEYVNLHLFSSINYMKAERYIMRLLKKRLSPSLHYHGIHHTKDVTEAAERLALMEGITGQEAFLLQTAATYHDAGFVEQYDANEPVGIRMAQEILPKYGYSEDEIEMIAGLINATIIPHDPKTHLQQIICDADLDYLGRDDFHQIADTLRLELREHGKINSDRAWDEMQVKFLNMHKYFTKSARNTRQAKKEKHIAEIMQRLKEDNYKD